MRRPTATVGIALRRRTELPRAVAPADAHADPVAPPVFETFRQSLQDLLSRGIPADERRRLVHEMKDTLVQAKMGLEDLRTALSHARKRLAHEERELETVRRRRQQAERIGDSETVAIAERFERTHAERVAVFAEKVRVQERELELTEGEVQEMTQALKSASLGAMPGGPRPGMGGVSSSSGDASPAEGADPLEDTLSPELDALRRSRDRATKEDDAARRLEELKRRMGQ